MRVVYVGTHGKEDPTLASLAMHIAANGSLEVGHDVSVVLAAHAADIVVGDNAETMEGIGIPPVRELAAKLKDNGVPVYV
jgi:predicted peroxiredoxin